MDGTGARKPRKSLHFDTFCVTSSCSGDLVIFHFIYASEYFKFGPFLSCTLKQSTKEVHRYQNPKTSPQ
jgi:hypothetical protein